MEMKTSILLSLILVKLFKFWSLVILSFSVRHKSGRNGQITVMAIFEFVVGFVRSARHFHQNNFKATCALIITTTIKRCVPMLQLLRF